jgi:hypothetical protein
VEAARKYHGYVFAWAIVYTFWFHPMEPTQGHLIGFFYMFLLMLQGSLFFTRLHVNKWWTFVQEILVLFHGTLVAIYQAGFWTPNSIWPMFFFGFFGIFIITQMHGLGLSLRARAFWLAVYGGLLLAVYGGLARFGRLGEVVSIPLIEYLSVFVLAGIIWLVLWIIGRVRPAAPRAKPVPASSSATD